MKIGKTEVVRARCQKSLRDGVREIATFQRLDESDIVRIAVESYVMHWRQAMLGKPIPTPFAQ